MTAICNESILNNFEINPVFNMKMKFLAIIALGLVLIGCKKAETSSNNSEVSAAANSNEVSMEQDVKTLTGPNGEQLTLIYFAEGTDVAVKINKNSEGEHKLVAKGVTEGGNPLFSDGEMVWEMNQDGQSGTLTEKGGKVTVFK